MEDNLGSQGRTNGTKARNTGERDAQQGLDSMDQQLAEDTDIYEEQADSPLDAGAKTRDTTLTP
jgi:hypothetical protein